MKRIMRKKLFYFGIIFGIVLIASIRSSYAQQNKLVMTATDTVYFDVQSDQAEFEMLKALYDQTGGANWKHHTNWLQGNTSADFSTWYGVTVENGDVVGVHLGNNNLTGEIPKDLYHLVRLRSVSFAGNSLQEKQEKQVTQKVGPSVKKQQSASFGEQQGASFETQSLLAPGAISVTSGMNLPMWGLAVAGPKLQEVDWRNYPPAVNDLVNSGASAIGSTGVAIDDCGRLAFYALHTGTDSPNLLHLYSADGTRLTNTTAGNPLQALSSVNGQNEMQVVRVPSKSDEWYLIYSKWKTPCLTSPPGSGYCPATVVYTRVKYNVDTHVLTIPSDTREVDISNGYTFIQGKAVSKDVNGDNTRHYLYLAQRQVSGVDMNKSSIHRYIIDQYGITFDAKSSLFPMTYWEGGIAASSIELTTDGQTLAMTNRNVGFSILEDIIIFDVNQINSISYQPVTISIPDLVLYGTSPLQTIKQYATSASKPCLLNIKNKMALIEFSPSGRYLYAIQGGYPEGTGGVTYNTYLLQIDLQSNTGSGYTVRLQTQLGIGVTTGCTGSATSVNDKYLQQIQSSYDGRIYFTKLNESRLFVIPNPDDPMPHSLTPVNVDLATGSVPNITMNSSAKVLVMPENIDGFEYLKESAVENFTLNKTSIGAGSSVILTLSGYSASNIYQVSWGDGSLQTITAATQSHTYTVAGNYKITLTTTLPDKCALKTSKDMEVVPCEEVVDISINNTVYHCAMKFSTRKLFNCLTTYNWDFGDGTTSLERNPIHVYSAAGDYTVTLNVTYNCGGCEGSKTVTKPIHFSPEDPTMENEIVEVLTDLRTRVIQTSASSFSDAWPLGHTDNTLDDKPSYQNGSQGVWRNNAQYVYEKDRGRTTPIVDVSKDGTFDLEQFNWRYAELNAVPNWIKANSVTRYSSYSFELENKDVLGVYSSALYDYAGQLPVANGVNMRQQEMAFTSFETLNVTSPVEFYDKRSSGNWVLGIPPLPAYTEYNIPIAQGNIAVVEASVAQLENVVAVDISTNTHYGWLYRSKTYLKKNEIICKTQHPDNPAWSIVVLKTAPFDLLWSGTLRFKNQVDATIDVVIDNAFAHSGIKSMKVTALKMFKEDVLKLEPGKIYNLSCWVSVNRPSNATPVLATSLVIDLFMRESNDANIQTFTFAPAGVVIEGWQQINGRFAVPAGTHHFYIRFRPGNAGGAWYDDLRLQPEEGNMKSYVYDPRDYRLKAILDEENFASFFYYDKEGNLYLTKKETKDGIKTLSENVSYMLERP